MWRHVWFVAAKDTRFMFREKSTLIWVFLTPLLFFYFIGTLTSGFSGSLSSGKQTLHCRHERETGFLAEHLERRLAENHFAVVRAGGGQSEAADDAAQLTIPDGFDGFGFASVNRNRVSVRRPQPQSSDALKTSAWRGHAALFPHSDPSFYEDCAEEIDRLLAG